MKRQFMMPSETFCGEMDETQQLIEKHPLQDDFTDLQEQIDSGKIDPAYLVPHYTSGSVAYRPPINI